MLMWKHPLVRAGVVLGMGFGGFADGIVLHQILGWHHLVCVTAHCKPASIEQLQLQNRQDGFFHLALWLVLLVGTGMLLRAARHAGVLASADTPSVERTAMLLRAARPAGVVASAATPSLGRTAMLFRAVRHARVLASVATPSVGRTAMIFRAVRHAGPAGNGQVLFGSMLAGWGLFNFVEGIIDHQILGIHHVLPGHPHQLCFDMLFLAAGVIFTVIGAWLIRSPRSAAA
jgi:uncharacterized membrane protein